MVNKKMPTSALHCSCIILMQGLFEYVRPDWEARPQPAAVDLDLKTFGATIPSRPTLQEDQPSGIPK